ncbi:MAG: polyprenyl synthetase family protein [Candidatus Altiarchaeota archaeon]
MEIQDTIKSKCASVEPFLRKYAYVGDAGIQKMILHPIEAGGKRIRPCLTILACEAVGGDTRKVLPAAAAVELLHTFTLVHDDIMDHDYQRRGRPTVHAIWGEEMGIIVGDTLYSGAFKALVDVRGKGVSDKLVLDAVNVLVKANGELQHGQIMDMLFEKMESVSEEEYMDMIQKKTGSLIEASVEIGGIIGGGSAKELKALTTFGANSGVAFQIKDDVLDLTADRKDFGKPIGSDIRSGKKTLIIVHAMEHAGERDIKSILRVLGREEASEKEVSQVIGKLKELGSIDYADQKVADLIAEGKKALNRLPKTDARESLKALADYLVKRRT